MSRAIQKRTKPRGDDPSKHLPKERSNISRLQYPLEQPNQDVKFRTKVNNDSYFQIRHDQDILTLNIPLVV